MPVGGIGVRMHAHIRCLSLAALALSVGMPAAAQVVEINDGETLTQDDLLAGSFMGQPFTLGPDLTFDVNSGGVMGPINPADPFSPRRDEGVIDFAGSLVRVNNGGDYLEGFGPLDVLNLRLTLAEGGSLPGGLVVRGGSDIRIQGGESAWPILLFGDDRIEVAGGRHDFIGLFEGGRGVFSGGVRSGIRAIRGSTVTFVGGDFRAAGAPAALGTGGIGQGEALGGVHPDGSVFVESGGIVNVNFGPDLPSFVLVEGELPPVRLEPFSVPEEPAPAGGLRPGQSLSLRDGGELRRDFHMLGATLDVSGGEVGRGLRAMGGAVSVSGGVLGNAEFFDGVDALITNGLFTGGIEAYESSVIAVQGGEVRGGVAIHDARAEFRGGLIDTVFAAGSSEIDVSGGDIDLGISLWGEASLALSGGTMRSVTAINNASVEFLGVDDVSSIGISDDAHFRMLGGTLPSKLFGDGVFELLGGAVTGPLTLRESARCLIAGAAVGADADLIDASMLQIESGSIGPDLNAWDEASIVLEGGRLGDGTILRDRASLIVSGGTVGDAFGLLGEDAALELIVRSLTVGGDSVAVAPDERVIIDARDVTLDAILADGTPIGFFLNTDLFAGGLGYFNPGATIPLRRAPSRPLRSP
jgi:hypothetical protein